MHSAAPQTLVVRHRMAWHGMGAVVWFSGTASRHVKLPENVAVASLARYQQARPEREWRGRILNRIHKQTCLTRNQAISKIVASSFSFVFFCIFLAFLLCLLEFLQLGHRCRRVRAFRI